MKLYFSNITSECYPIDYYKELIINGEYKEIELTEAKIEYGTGYFFCTEYLEHGEVGEGCGKVCEHYSPRNGKNGRCRYSNNVYQMTDNKFTIR